MQKTEPQTAQRIEPTAAGLKVVLRSGRHAQGKQHHRKAGKDQNFVELLTIHACSPRFDFLGIEWRNRAQRASSRADVVRPDEIRTYVHQLKAFCRLIAIPF